jgi:hypothetical protein
MEGLGDTPVTPTTSGQTTAKGLLNERIACYNRFVGGTDRVCE